MDLELLTDFWPGSGGGRWASLEERHSPETKPEAGGWDTLKEGHQGAVFQDPADRAEWWTLLSEG